MFQAGAEMFTDSQTCVTSTTHVICRTIKFYKLCVITESDLQDLSAKTTPCTFPYNEKRQIKLRTKWFKCVWREKENRLEHF
jgi:hypothetical protein